MDRARAWSWPCASQTSMKSVSSCVNTCFNCLSLCVNQFIINLFIPFFLSVKLRKDKSVIFMSPKLNCRHFFSTRRAGGAAQLRFVRHQPRGLPLGGPDRRQQVCFCMCVSIITVCMCVIRFGQQVCLCESFVCTWYLCAWLPSSGKSHILKENFHATLLYNCDSLSGTLLFINHFFPFPIQLGTVFGQTRCGGGHQRHSLDGARSVCCVVCLWLCCDCVVLWWMKCDGSCVHIFTVLGLNSWLYFRVHDQFKSFSFISNSFCVPDMYSHLNLMCVFWNWCMPKVGRISLLVVKSRW